MIKQRIHFWFLTAALCGSVSNFQLHAEEPVQIVLFAGQSNMQGAGNYDALNESDLTATKSAAKQINLRNSKRPPSPLSYTASKYKLEKYGFTNSFGPELFVGVTLHQKEPEQKYVFIKRAQGGTALYGAWNPDWSAEKSREVEKEGVKQTLQLVNEHIQLIHEELARIEATGNTYAIIGMCWMQGENDAAKEVSARSYEANLKQLIAHYRHEFKLPEMPFIAGQINSHYGRFDEGPSMVRQAVLNIAAEDPHVAAIETTADAPWHDFPKHSDNVHYNTEGQQRLGIAFATELLKLNP